MNTLILNRDFQLPADGWFHVVPLGEFPHEESGLIQVIDSTAAAAMVNRFKSDSARPNFPGLLVDFDHFSDDPSKRSAAAGWIEDLQNRTDGVWAKIRFSGEGEAAVKGGSYRLVSPVFNRRDAEVLANAKRIRPLRLVKLALTNDPNLKGMVPISNREPTQPAENQKRTMKQLNTLLGLSADASEEAAIAEVTKLKNRVEAAEKATAELPTINNRVKQLEKDNAGLLNEQVEADMDAVGIKDKETRTSLTPFLVTLANREARKAWLKRTYSKPTEGPVHNRHSAGTPEVTEIDTKRQEKAINEYRLANRCTYEQARNAVRRESPELFGA